MVLDKKYQHIFGVYGGNVLKGDRVDFNCKLATGLLERIGKIPNFLSGHRKGPHPLFPHTGCSEETVKSFVPRNV
jgi:hypothetical protein